MDAFLRAKLSNADAETLVDVEDWEAVIPYSYRTGETLEIRPASYAWQLAPATGAKWRYAVIKPERNGRKYVVSLHRLVMRARPGQIVDHRNSDRLDNRKSNLRLCTTAENIANMDIRGGSSRFKGVYRDRDGRWHAQIGHQSRRYNLGKFKSEVDAARAYDAKALELFGEFARLNLQEAIA